MRVLVTGARGLLGTEVCRELALAGHEVLDFGREFDVSDPECTARIAVGEFGQLNWVINCAAYTAVDGAESDPQDAYETNTLGLGYLSASCNVAMVKILHVSTDFVFDGLKGAPYTEEDIPKPMGVYGRTKLEGERALSGNHRAVVVRTSWLFGPNGKCFPKSILAAYDAGKNLRVVSDQIGTPTYTPHLAKALVQTIEKDPFPGVYHLAGSKICSWYDFASVVIAYCRNVSGVVAPISTEEWPTPAKRPRYSALDSSKIREAGVPPMPAFEEAIQEFCRAQTTEK